jgi:hypothetical protein
MNTTKLIEHWTMDGASRDINGRFRKTDDILKVLASERGAPAEPAVTDAAALQVRGADEDDWTALGVGGEGAGGRVW